MLFFFSKKFALHKFNDGFQTERELHTAKFLLNNGFLRKESFDRYEKRAGRIFERLEYNVIFYRIEVSNGAEAEAGINFIRKMRIIWARLFAISVKESGVRGIFVKMFLNEKKIA